MANKSNPSLFRLTKGRLLELMQNIGLQVPACPAKRPERLSNVVGVDCLNGASGVRQTLLPSARTVPAPRA